MDLCTSAVRCLCFVGAWDNVVVLGGEPWSPSEMVYGVGLDEACCLFVCGVDSHGSNEVCSFGVEPDRNDDEFGEIEVWRCADKFRGGPEWRREVFHDARDIGVGDDLVFFVVRDGAGCVGDGLSYEKVGSNFNEGGEFVYMCGSELCHGGENVESGLRVEPVLVEKCLK